MEMYESMNNLRATRENVQEQKIIFHSTQKFVKISHHEALP